jgi:hypothetical protein
MTTSTHRAGARVALLALLAPVFAALLGVGTAPMASADVTGLKAQLGGGYTELVTGEIGALCGEDLQDCTESTESTPELWEAALECGVTPRGDAPRMTRDELGSREETAFMGCMAEAGFGEAPDDEDEDAISKLSLAQVSAALTESYVNNMSPADNGVAVPRENGRRISPDETARGLDAWAPILSHPAQAGAFVGALDRSDKETKTNSEWLFGPGNAANTAEVKFASFSRNLNAEGDRGWLGQPVAGGGVGLATDRSGELVPDAGVEAYLTYGALLSGLGLDSTINPTDSAGLLSSHGIRGYVMLVAYMGAGAVDTFFDTVLEALQWLNPFRFMVDAVADTAGGDVAAGMAGQPCDQDSAFDGLRDMFGKVYSALVSIGWMIIVPLLLVTLLLGMTMLRSTRTGSKVKRLVIIVVFLALGLPLFGTMYTAGLTAMAGATADSARANSTKVVLSTLVDFENWVSRTRLAPPAILEEGDYFGWNSLTNSPTGQSEAMVRRFAESINSAAHSDLGGVTPQGPVDPSQSIDLRDDRTWATTVIKRRGDGSPVGAKGFGQAADTFSATQDLIRRYATGATISASGFESEVKGAFDRAIRSSDDPERARTTVAGWFEELSDPARLAEMTSQDVARLSNPLLQVESGSGLGARPQGDGDSDGEASAWAYKRIGTPACDLTSGGVVPAGWDGAPNAGLVSCNFSPVAMYNYLNTSFGSTSMELFSPTSTKNSYSRVNHAAVSSVGAGPAGILYFFSAMTVLGSFVIIGFLYGLGLMFSSIKRAFSLIGAALGSAVGLLSAIAKVAVLTAALFIELFATLFLYKVVQEFIVIVPTILEKPLAEKLTSAPGAGSGMGNTGTAQMVMDADPDSQWGAAAAAAGAAVTLSDQRSLGIVALMITLATTAALMMFTFMSVKLRRGLLDTIDQGVTNLVNKFIETDVQGGMAVSEPGSFRTGLARGGMMGMSSMMISGAGASGTDDAADGQWRTVSNTETSTITRSDGSTFSIDSSEGTLDGALGEGVGSGAMQVVPDGRMINRSGDPVLNQQGSQVQLGDLVPIDARSGHVLDAPGGSPVIGADGSPLHADEIGGFNSEGKLIDAEGSVITNEAGGEMVSQPASVHAAWLLGEKRLAAQALRDGLTTHPAGTLGMQSRPELAPGAAVAAAGGDTEDTKLPGETPDADASGRGFAAGGHTVGAESWCGLR